MMTNGRWTAPAPRPISPIHCPTCGRTLGATDGRVVYLVASYIADTVTLNCPAAGCAGRFTWHAPPELRRPRRRDRR